MQAKRSGGREQAGAKPVGGPAEEMDGGGRWGGAGQGGDEDGGGEEDADGELLGQAAGTARTARGFAWRGGGGGVAEGGTDVEEQRLGVDDDHPGGEEGGEKDIEMQGAGVGAVEEGGEDEGAEQDDGEEGGAVLVVEAVTGFEVGWGDEGFGDARFGGASVGDGRVEDAGVEEAVGCIDHPDGHEHGGEGGPGEGEVGAAGDEEGPEGGDGGGVEGEEMPESEGGVAGVWRRDELGAWGVVRGWQAGWMGGGRGAHGRTGRRTKTAGGGPGG